MKTPAILAYNKFSPVDLAHLVWNSLLQRGDIAIDATCGNGLDSLFIAQRILDLEQQQRLGKSDFEGQPSVRLHCIDIQASAIETTRRRLENAGYRNQIKYHHCSHELLPPEVEPESVSLATYNLGYLPASNKQVITLPHSTISSLSASAKLIRVGGVLSVTSYRGHPGGLEETDAVEEFARSQSPQHWRTIKHEMLSKPLSPILYTLYKLKSTEDNRNNN